MKINFNIRNKKPLSINSPEFYRKHPDLIPDNPLLARGRIKTIEEVDKQLDKIIKPTLKEKLINIKEMICQKIKTK